MEQQKPIKPQALEALVETLKSDYRHLTTLHNSSWRTTEEREEARLALARSTKEAKSIVQQLEGTKDPVLYGLYGQLLIQATLAADAVKNPATLKR